MASPRRFRTRAQPGQRRQWVIPLLLLWGLAAAFPRPGLGQASVEVRIRLTDDTTRGHRNPVVGTASLLADPRWVEVLRSGFPLRLHYTVEMWRTRRGWFDAQVRQVEWDVVVRHEPLLDQYAVNTIMPGRTGETRFTGIESLARALDAVSYQIAFRRPPPGEYYYIASLRVSTLSDTDLDELERFLRGEPGGAPPESRDLGDAVGRGATRLLLRLAGLPSVRVEGRSGRFMVR